MSEQYVNLSACGDQVTEMNCTFNGTLKEEVIPLSEDTIALSYTVYDGKYKRGEFEEEIDIFEEDEKRLFWNNE